MGYRVGWGEHTVYHIVKYWNEFSGVSSDIAAAATIDASVKLRFVVKFHPPPRGCHACMHAYIHTYIQIHTNTYTHT